MLLSVIYLFSDHGRQYELQLSLHFVAICLCALQTLKYIDNKVKIAICLHNVASFTDLSEVNHLAAGGEALGLVRLHLPHALLDALSSRSHLRSRRISPHYHTKNIEEQRRLTSSTFDCDASSTCSSRCRISASFSLSWLW